jgi:CRISPR/Cas system-associated endoribonuclease Cas2
MKTYLITYDLDKPEQNYTGLIGRLGEHGAIRVALSVWAVQSAWTAIQLREDLKRFIDSNDRLLVAEITSNWASWNIFSSQKFQEIAA